MRTANADPKTLQEVAVGVRKGTGEHAALPIEVSVIIVHIRIRTRIGARTVRRAVEAADRVGKETACHVAGELHTDVAVRHEVRGQPELDEAVVDGELQTFEADGPFELSRLNDEPRLESSVHIGIENNGLAVAKIRDEPIVEDLVDSAIDIGTHLSQHPRVC